SYDCLRRCRSSSSGRTFGRSASACDLVNVGICSRSSMGPGGSAVATYVLLTRVTAAGVKTLQANPRRIKEVNKEIEALGARVVAQYATLGRYDFVNIVEAKDSETIARVSVGLGARGTVQSEALSECPAHLTCRGGANWRARFGDPEAELLSRGDDASRALARMGILTARDVGAPHRLNLRIRDRVRGRTDAPEILAAGTWLARRD